MYCICMRLCWQGLAHVLLDNNTQRGNTLHAETCEGQGAAEILADVVYMMNNAPARLSGLQVPSWNRLYDESPQ